MPTVAFDPFDAQTQENPYPVYARLRDEEPLHHFEREDLWVLSRYSDIRKALTTPDLFSSTKGTGFDQDDALGTVIDSDPPLHTKLRAPLVQVFQPRHVAALQPKIKEISDDLLEPLREREQIELVEDFAAPLATTIIALLLGLDPADWRQFRTWSHTLNSLSWDEDPAARRGPQFFGLITELSEYLLEVARASRDAPEGEDTLLSRLWNVDTDGEPLSDQTIGLYGSLLLLAGNITTTSAITNAMLTMIEFPDVRDRLRREPELLGTAIEEFLRLESPVQGFARSTTREIELHGITLPEGAQVQLLFGAANRDETVFDDAGVPTIERKPNPHMAFGAGPHFCLGAALSRLEMRIALDLLLAEMDDFALVPEDPIVRSRHPATRDVDKAPMRIEWAQRRTNRGM
ncbi:MAG TPA: cytochrome P450 [Solirubrobacteraceae bacterium]|nr:cytochrome P450 [Solirubrobacteraceae bacterium]